MHTLAIDDRRPEQAKRVNFDNQNTEKGILAGIASVAVVGNHKGYQPLGVLVPPVVMIRALRCYTNRTPRAKG